MVGTVRFELTTSCTPSKRATKLRYVPNHSPSGRTGRDADSRAPCRVFNYFYWETVSKLGGEPVFGEKVGWLGGTKPDGLLRENPPGGESFARGRRWLVPYSPLRGCLELASLATAKILRRRPPPNFETGSYPSSYRVDLRSGTGGGDVSLTRSRGRLRHGQEMGGPHGCGIRRECCGW